jgi:hypothetical protein
MVFKGGGVLTDPSPTTWDLSLMSDQNQKGVTMVAFLYGWYV